MMLTFCQHAPTVLAIPPIALQNQKEFVRIVVLKVGIYKLWWTADI